VYFSCCKVRLPSGDDEFKHRGRFCFVRPEDSGEARGSNNKRRTTNTCVKGGFSHTSIGSISDRFHPGCNLPTPDTRKTPFLRCHPAMERAPYNGEYYTQEIAWKRLLCAFTAFVHGRLVLLSSFETDLDFYKEDRTPALDTSF